MGQRPASGVATLACNDAVNFFPDPAYWVRMLQDLRAAARVIAGDRWFSAAAVVALALGIGVNATVFTLINAARPIP
jgi:hypothetical protein